MSSVCGSNAELRRQSVCQAEEARQLHQLVKDTRRVVEETAALLTSPIWAQMGAPVPASGLPATDEEPAA